MLTLTAIVMAGMLHGRPAQSTACLHEPGTETADQADRAKHAVGLARMINSAEAVYHSKFGSYGKLEELVTGDFVKPAPASGEYVAGFKLRLDVMDRAYWFSVTDTTDPCGFRYISNQDGLIFTAKPLQ
jgi:hypothetical protein